MPDPIKTPAANPQVPAPASAKEPQAASKPISPAPASQTPAAQTPGASQTPAQEGTQVPISALHEEREKRQQLQAQLEAMKKVMTNNVLFDAEGNPVMQQPQAPAPQDHYQQELDKLWETDPRRAVQTEIYSAMAWRDRLDANVDRQANDVALKYQDFNSLRSEVMNYLRTMPLEQRDKPGMVEAAYYFVRGQKVDNIIAQKQKELEAEYLRKFQSGELASSLPAGSTSAPLNPQGAVTLTEDQKKAAAAMRVSEAEYAKWIKV